MWLAPTLLFLLDEGALIRPMTFVSAMNAAVWYFLFSAEVFPPTTIGVASVAPPSSVVLRPGVTDFVTGDRVHSLRGSSLAQPVVASIGRDCATSAHSSLRFFGAFLCLKHNTLA